MSDGAYVRPTSLEDALALKAGGDRLVLAGGTDVFPIRANQQAWGQYQRRPVLDISALDELRAIEQNTDHWRFGALATWSETLNADLPPAFDGLKLAAREVGGAQIQNRGTLAGNLVNASPAADGVPPLLTLDARIEVKNARKTREIPLQQFIDGYRHTVLKDDELVTAIVIPKPAAGAVSHFLKLGARRYLVISIAMAAGVLAADNNGQLTDARISLGSCSPVAVRLGDLERDLIGQKLKPGIGDIVARAHLSAVAPIDDVRASADYRLAAAQTLIADMLEQMAAGEHRRLDHAG
jgi:N-methylhydantoinase B